ncbi:hypothetical protein HYW58_02350 [Candidatus Kaiserbacteria bacterium]|nr:hypothetical protein [Candidatus Kaiserbacteria bacterium]
MIYALYGNDTHTSREKLHALLHTLCKKRPRAECFHITSENRETYNIQELIVSRGLFEEKYIVVLDGLLEAGETRDELLLLLKDMKESEHIFIFLEETLDAKTREKFERHAEKIQQFQTTGGKKNRFNAFLLTDAFGERDRKKLWTLLQRAKRENVSDEEIHGILFWQVKNMLIAKETRNAKESGLNPFVHKKASQALSRFSEKELETLAKTLVSLSHDARRGVHEFDTALERFVLSV